jgi:trafficking protein particle complex subunit 6
MSFESPLPPFNASDPNATFLNSSCLDLLMIELVPMAYRVVNEVEAGAEGRGLAGLDNGKIAATSVLEGALVSSGPVVTRSGGGMDEDEERDAVFFRLEMLGYRVGQGLVER